MKKLYDLTTTEDTKKQELYLRKTGKTLDFMTYFNSFSLAKWKQYTTLQTITLQLRLFGRWQITWKTADAQGEHILCQEICDGEKYQHSFDAGIKGILLGFTLRPLSKGSRYLGGSWYGTFADWQEKKIGISICTFKRENYVRRTIQVLQEFQTTHPWLSVLVVDNGRTLQEVKRPKFRIVHNPNYGGSGGFTRGMMEYVDEGIVDYVLMMDDDIILDPTALERSHAVLCGLKEKYQDSFLSGAMLRLETPTIQHENTACWGKIRLHSFGQNFDLTDVKTLVKNETNLSQCNRYGAWWYCGIPSQRIQEIGYPLPVFVKGDDMEYGIRNHRTVLHMNGIGVWHQSFQSKISPVVNYYSDRNMLIINNYADGCGFLSFAASVMGRLVKRSLQGNLQGLHCLYQALVDYNKGFSGLTQMPLDKKMQEVSMILKQDADWTVVLKVLGQVLTSILHYPRTLHDYRNFRELYLKDSRFWKKYFLAKRN